MPGTKSDSNDAQMLEGKGEQKGGEEEESEGKELFEVMFGAKND